MTKRISLLVLLLCIFLAACGNEDTSENASSSTESETNAETKSPSELVGEHITMNEKGIEFPFSDPVTEAHFSEDGKVKVFVTKDIVIGVNDTEIVHVHEAESAHIYASPTVSADGKYATWRRDGRNDDYAIVILDVENRSVDYVESTDKYDVYSVFLFSPLIEIVDGEYYLVTNTHIYGSDVDMTLNLETKEMYSREYPEDEAVLGKLKPEPIFSGDETFMTKIETWAVENNLMAIIDSYYGYYSFYYEFPDDDEPIIKQAYGVYTPEPKIIELGLEEHGIDLADPNREIDRDDILVHDNGSLVFTQYEPSGEEQYKMYTYYIDMANTPVEPALLHEGDFDHKKSVIFNHDATGVYISEEGRMDFIEL